MLASPIGSGCRFRGFGDSITIVAVAKANLPQDGPTMEFDYLSILLRWMHVFAAIALFGGSIFQRVALLPAGKELAADQRQRLSDEVRRRWSRVVMLSILFLLVSGFVNFVLTINLFKDAGLKAPSLYHVLWGTKVILALVVFFFASALAGRGAATQKFRDNAGKWLTVNLVLATLIVAISGVLRATHTAPNEAVPRTSSSPAVDRPASSE